MLLKYRVWPSLAMHLLGMVTNAVTMKTREAHWCNSPQCFSIKWAVWGLALSSWNTSLSRLISYFKWDWIIVSLYVWVLNYLEHEPVRFAVITVSWPNRYTSSTLEVHFQNRQSSNSLIHVDTISSITFLKHETRFITESDSASTAECSAVQSDAPTDYVPSMIRLK